MQKFLVGGRLRDEALGRASHDTDYAVEGPATFQEMCDLVVADGYKIHTTTPEFFTARATKDRVGYDFVLCRKETGYRDKRHPDKIEVGTIYDDLARRDFTINAMAQADDGTRLDPHGGMEDIQRRRIRCVGSVERLREDGLRILRALRFALVLDFELDVSLQEAFVDPKILDCLVGVHPFRMVQELNKMFECDVVRSIQLLSKYPILRDYLLSQMRLKAIVAK